MVQSDERNRLEGGISIEEIGRGEGQVRDEGLGARDKGSGFWKVVKVERRDRRDWRFVGDGKEGTAGQTGRKPKFSRDTRRHCNAATRHGPYDFDSGGCAALHARLLT